MNHPLLLSEERKGGKKREKEMGLERSSVCSACQSNKSKKKGDQKND
jgi:hypothetical protein